MLTNFVALTLGAGVTARPILKAGTTSIVNIPAGTTSSVQHFVQYINVSASTTARTITFTAGTPPTSPTTCDLVICQVDPDVATLKRRALPAPKLDEHDIVVRAISPSESKDEKQEDDEDDEFEEYLKWQARNRAAKAEAVAAPLVPVTPASPTPPPVVPSSEKKSSKK